MLDVSIIIPCYVTSPEGLIWLDECLKSTDGQGCEVCVCDDGSPVDVEPIIKKHRVDWYAKSPDNRGVSHARNAAIVMATKSLILPLDSDDRLVKGAVEDMLKYWDGVTPVYPDVTKFGEGISDEYYTLLDFNCDYLDQFVGFTSVNVLHSKAQWLELGGYDESIEYFEDGEYNARLMGKYCAVRCPVALVDYRQHSLQRTKKYGSASEYARQLLSQIRRYDKMCKSCSGRKSASNYASNSMPAAGASSRTTVQGSAADPVTLPTTFQGKVLALYTGGRGMGAHYYRGVKTKFPYRVTNGDYLYADPADVCEPAQTWSYLKRVIPQAQPAPAPTPVAVPPQKIVAKPEPAPEIPEEVKSVPAPATHDDLPDISEMNVKEITGLSITQEQAAILLQYEKDGLNRTKVVKWLESRLS